MKDKSFKLYLNEVLFYFLEGKEEKKNFSLYLSSVQLELYWHRNEKWIFGLPLSIGENRHWNLDKLYWEQVVAWTWTNFFWEQVVAATRINLHKTKKINIYNRGYLKIIWNKRLYNTHDCILLKRYPHLLTYERE